MQGQIERSESELPAIKNAGGGQLRVVHLLDRLRGNLLRRIAIIGREGIEDLLVPNPVLQHLRRRLDKIAGDMRACEASIFRARHDGMESVTEFVEERFDVGVRHEERACPRSAAENCKAARRSGADIFRRTSSLPPMMSNCAK